MTNADRAPVLHTYHLGPRVTAFSTTRQGGCSEGSYASFNINPYCGDTEEHVAANRQALCSLLGIDGSRLVLPHQVHGIESRVIDSQFFSLPASRREAAVDGVDIVMTQLTDVCIGVSTADCIPLLISDPHRHAVCAVHAGWRGTVARAAQKAVADMRAAFGSQPSHLQVVVGPGISIGAFEVGDEVYERFVEARFDMGRLARRQDKWHIDLPACNRDQLIQAGVPQANIHLSGLCTVAQAGTFFSARTLGTRSGRIYNGIMLRKAE